MNILIAYEASGALRRRFRAAGHNAMVAQCLAYMEAQSINQRESS